MDSPIILHGCEIKSGRGRPGFEAKRVDDLSTLTYLIGIFLDSGVGMSDSLESTTCSEPSAL